VTEDRQPTLVGRLEGLVSLFWRELAKFGVIGAIGFVIDFGGFNLLFYGPLAGHLTTSKIISGATATLVAWVGNRMWTFRHRRNRPAHHEALLFFVVNGVGLVISTLWLNITHDYFGLTSRGAVNLNTIIGIGLATVFRFWAYRQVVFAGEHPGDPEGESPDNEATTAVDGDGRPVEHDRGPTAP
jgi:putative flippase GtrA